ncbi:MAG TPA: hypothetical protein VM662_02050 [Sphingomonas sp.]|nr:hypothetical protein [Sphingomonas sp.]
MPALAQSATETPLPVQAVERPAATSQVMLPANTELTLSMNEELTTKGGRIEVGQKFGLTLTHDVTIGDYIVLPRGTPAFGEVTGKTGKGAFGKSGKMEIELRYLDLAGRRIPVSGKYRQEGEGNTVATVGGVILAGVFAGFVTGKSARIPQGRELKAYTTEALPVAMPAAAAAPAPIHAAPPVAPAPATAGTASTTTTR